MKHTCRAATDEQRADIGFWRKLVYTMIPHGHPDWLEEVAQTCLRENCCLMHGVFLCSPEQEQCGCARCQE